MERIYRKPIGAWNVWNGRVAGEPEGRALQEATKDSLQIRENKEKTYTFKFPF